ncbi:MAG: OmpA family protein [Chlorobi bacterium]|nr:OmpA family protein [Chlorobiota bacterium]
MKIVFNLTLIFFYILFSNTGFAQKSVTEKADETFQAGGYFLAIDQYKQAYGKTKDKVIRAQIVYNVAVCYRKINNYRQAEIWFRKAIKKNHTNPLMYLYYADALKINQKYEEAIENYEKYSKLVPDDPQGEHGVESCKLAQEWEANPTRYKVENMAYFNSRQSDFSPAYARDGYDVIFFTSSREEATGNEIQNVTGESFCDIFYSREDRKGKWSIPLPLGENINTKDDEGMPSLNNKGNILYFTRCAANDEEKFGCQIYSANKQGVDWAVPKAITVGSDTSVVAHPSISKDELTLYFTANLKGGKGGKDIWRIKRESAAGEWGKPENLGSDINTPGDEMFPYIHADGTLYFSSNYHLGMGGLDIFFAIPQNDGSWLVENMKYPINSPADDFGIIFEGEKERGYFSSNRDGGRGSDDIYQFSLPPMEFSLIGRVINEYDEKVISNANVKLIGSDGSTLEQVSEEDGTFHFTLKPNTDYRIITRKGGFLAGKGKETTKGLDISKEFRTDIFMSPDNVSIELEIFYDLGKWDLRPESLIALEDLVETLNDNPNITIELGSHTDYRSSSEYNRELSQKRAQSVVDFLIDYGIDEDRLSSKGYGEDQPKVVDMKTARKYDFLKEGDVLTEQFINSLPTEEQREKANQINRRTEFRVTGTDYVPKIKRRN